MQRYGTGRMYLNFPLVMVRADHLVREALGPETYGRLARVKHAYDPDNLFRMNQNVQPTGRSGKRLFPTIRRPAGLRQAASYSGQPTIWAANG